MSWATIKDKALTEWRENTILVWVKWLLFIAAVTYIIKGINWLLRKFPFFDHFWWGLSAWVFFAAVIGAYYFMMANQDFMEAIGLGGKDRKQRDESRSENKIDKASKKA